MTPNQPSIADRLRAIQRRIDAACERVGRDPAGVTLVGVSKRQPVDRIRAAHEAGLVVFGENQVQEAVGKSAELPLGIDWHFIGHLQSNKTKAAARLFNTIHSIDRLKIAQRLDHEAELLGRRLRVFVQVNIGAEETKSGYSPEGLAEELGAVRDLESLEILGLMAIPPWEEDPEASRHWFRELRELRDAVARRSDWPDFPGALSMGMSHDFEVAIEEGATHVRVGTAIFGPRPS